MEFTIYTAGGSEFLEIVLNACAMLTGSGSIDDMARVGAIIGVAILALQAVYRGSQGIEFHKVGLMLVCYMVFYGPVATTVVQDTTSDQVRVIDNIPVGPAFIGSLFSTVAYQITELSEQAWSTPGMTRYGLFSSLTTLTRVRDVLRNPVGLDQFQNYRRSEGWDLGRSFQEYMTYCNFNPVFLRNNMTVDQLYRAGDVGALLSNSSEAQSIYVYNQNPPQLMTCAAAGKVLTAALSDVLPLVMDDVMQKGFSDQVQSGQMTNFAQMQASLDNSLQSFGWSNKKASDYVASSLIQRYFSQGRVDALNHWQERRAAMALQQSLSQQEVQWAGKGDSFKFYIKPIMSFVEGLVYAVTPFMAMIMLMGGRGVASLMKFATLPLASGLCMPLLSFVNAFTLWYAGSKIQAILNGYDPISTGFAQMQLMDMDQALGTALGLGGYLASSVPVIAASIVGAGAMGVSALMSGATSDSKFNSEDVQPRTQRPAPVMATESVYTSDQVGTGVSKTGVSKMAESFSPEQVASAAVQSASQASHNAMSQYQSSLKAAGQEMNSTSSGRQALAQIGQTLGTSSVLSANSSYNQARETLKGLNVSESSIAQATANAAMGISTPLGGLKRTDNTSADSMTQESRAAAEKALSQLTSSVQSTNSDQLTFATGDAFNKSDIAQSSVSNVSEIGKTQSQALQAQSTYSQIYSQQDSIKAGQSLNLRDAGVKSLARGDSKKESAQQLMEMAGRTESGRELFRKAIQSQSIQDMSTDRDERIAMAAIRTMNQDGRLGDLLLSKYSPFDLNVSQGDANKNEYLQRDTETALSGSAGLESNFKSKWSGNAAAINDQRNMNSDGYTETKASGAQAVEERDNINNLVVTGAHLGYEENISSKRGSAAYDSIAKKGEAARQGTNLGQSIAEGANAVTTGLDTIEHLFRSGDDSAKKDNYYKVGVNHGLAPEEAKYFAAKATGEFGASQGAAYQELSEFYRSQGIKDENYIAGAITAIDEAAKAPESGAYPTLSVLNDSRSEVRREPVQVISNDDVPMVPPQDVSVLSSESFKHHSHGVGTSGVGKSEAGEEIGSNMASTYSQHTLDGSSYFEPERGKQVLSENTLDAPDRTDMRQHPVDLEAGHRDGSKNSEAGVGTDSVEASIHSQQALDVTSSSDPNRGIQGSPKNILDTPVHPDMSHLSNDLGANNREVASRSEASLETGSSEVSMHSQQALDVISSSEPERGIQRLPQNMLDAPVRADINHSPVSPVENHHQVSKSTNGSRGGGANALRGVEQKQQPKSKEAPPKLE